MTTSLRPEHNESLRYRALRLLEHSPHLTQRELARELGVSVGKVNFLLKALAEKGYLVLGNFQRGDQKLKKLAYLLTPEGLQHRLSLTRGYLERKTKEYHALHAELASLRAELEAAGQPPANRYADSGEAGQPSADRYADSGEAGHLPATCHAEWAATDHHPSPLVGEGPGERGN